MEDASQALRLSGIFRPLIPRYATRLTHLFGLIAHPDALNSQPPEASSFSACFSVGHSVSASKYFRAPAVSGPLRIALRGGARQRCSAGASASCLRSRRPCARWVHGPRFDCAAAHTSFGSSPKRERKTRNQIHSASATCTLKKKLVPATTCRAYAQMQ